MPQILKTDISVDEISTLLVDARRASTLESDILQHSYDAWPVMVKARQAGENKYRPDVVVNVVSTDEISIVLKYANDKAVPITAWGLGSSVVGSPLAEFGGISLDTSKMNKLIKIDKLNNTVTAEAGMQGGELESLLQAEGMTMNFSPQSLHRSSIGGWVATRATGQFSSRYGGIEDALVAIEVVLADGTIIETLQLPRMAVGTDIKSIFIGSEGCFGVVSKVTLRIYPKAETQLFKTIDFPDVQSGVAAMRDIMGSGLRPFLLRFYDLEEARFAMHDSAYLTPVMFLGCDGLTTVATAELEACIQIAEKYGGSISPIKGTEAWMERRFDFSAIENVLDTPGGVAETIEVSHNWQGIEKTHSVLKQRLGKESANVLGHFSHAYVNGVSLYMILVSEEESLEASRDRLNRIWKVSMETAIETGASISHHHGAGLARAPYVRQSLGSGHQILTRLKTILDPKGILNPGNKLGFGRA